MNRNLLGAFAVLGGLMAGHQANATLLVTASIGGAATGVTYENFDSLLPGTGGGLTGSLIAVSFVPDAAAVSGAASGLYAEPYLSGGNGQGFGSQPNGIDTTVYLTSGATNSFSAAAVTLALPFATQYFGLLWGSVDAVNTLSFFNGATLVGTVTGAQANASPNGDQGLNGTVYVNINSDLAFDRVVATSAEHAFEFDNVAFNATPVGVPEPMTLSVLGADLLGLGMVRRLRGRKA